jgi:hypothetical protein
LGSVTVTADANVYPAGISATGQVGRVLVWGTIVPDQTPNWSQVSPSQTPSWTEIAA